MRSTAYHENTPTHRSTVKVAKLSSYDALLKFPDLALRVRLCLLESSQNYLGDHLLATRLSGLRVVKSTL